MYKNKNKKSVLPTVKIVRDFSVHILGIPLPKNALYIKLNSGYVYVTDFKQFETRQNSVKVHVLWNNKQSFNEEYIDLNESLAGRLLKQKIKELNYYNTEVIEVLSRKKLSALTPKLRQDNEYNFKPTNRVNFGLTTDFDMVPQWKLDSVRK